MNTTIIKTFPRALFQPHPAHAWQIVQDARGYFAVDWFDVNKLTPEERAAHDAEVAVYPEWMDEQDEAYEAHERAAAPRWPTIALAEAWTQIQDAENNISAELDACHAPSECGGIAYRGVNEEAAALLLLSDRPQDAAQYNPSLRSAAAAWPFPDHQY